MSLRPRRSSSPARPRSRRPAAGRSAALLLAALVLSGTAGGAGNLSSASGTWEAAGNLNFARSFATATTLASGRVLLVGGQGSAGPLRAAELYDPAARTWSPAGSTAEPRVLHAAVRLADGDVLVAGGYASGYLASTELYHPASNSWTPGPDLAAARANASATALADGRALVAGGSGGAILASTEIYDPASNSWAPAAPMSIARTEFSSTRLEDGRVLVVGGYNESGYLASAELYDPTGDSWSSAGSLATSRYGASATLLDDGSVLVAGGFGNSQSPNFLASAERYDPDSNSWSAAGDMSTPRSGFAAFRLPDGSVIAIGSGGSITATTDVYDPRANSWSAGPSMATGRVRAAASSLAGGDVIVAGGDSGGLPFASSELFVAAKPETVHVEGNRIVDASGAPLVLHGVNRSGPEYMCINGYGIFDGPSDAASVAAMAAWGANAVRVPLNEDCWLDVNGVDPAYAGANYRQAIAGYVATLEGQGMVPILDLQWTAPGTEPARDPIKPMPDRDHSVDFWRDVATTFKDDGGVVFDLFNEPYPDGNRDTTAAWVCWRDGTPCPGVSFDAVGMQELVDTVRATGARNLILLGGVRFANAIARWPEFAPSDPVGNIAPSWHVYPYNLCHTPACFDADVGPLLAGLPVVAGEIGSAGSYPACDRDSPDATMLWLDAHSLGYLAWAWDAWGQCDALILDYAGVPTESYGRTYRDHLLGIPQRPSGVVAAAGDGTAAVSWIPSADHGSTAVLSYTVTASPGGATATVPGWQTSASVSGLANGIGQVFTVTATNTSGTSAPSSPSAAVTPQAGSPPPAAATGSVSASSPTTVSTSADPAATGGTSTSVTVPAGTAGGTVTVTQGATSEPQPGGYLFGGVQVDVSAPAATAANPLVLVFTTTPPPGAPLDDTTLGSTEIYRTEGTAAPVLLGDCSGPPGQARPDPCVSSREYVTIGGTTYVRLTALSSTASHWNSATPAPGAVTVSDAAYSPPALSVRPGAPVTWTFTGRRSHTVTDAAGLGPGAAPWFGSGAKTTGTFRFAFPSAGSFSYRSTVKGDSLAGSILVPVLVAPASGGAGTSFAVAWSTNTLSGFVFDVQYRFRASGAKQWKSWVAWKTGVGAPRGSFTASQAGSYAFRARLRNAATGRASGYSPEATIAVS